MKENKLLKILLISVVFGLGACSSTNASISSTSNDLMNSTSSAINKDTVKKYTVKWVVDDKVFEETYKEGETPTYKFGTSKEADNTYTYTFSGWDKLIKPVTENVTYTAQYIKEYIDYTYTWVIGEEEVTETYHYGDEVSYKGEEPTKEGTDQYSYVFTGWGKELGTVTGDEVLEAQFEKVLNTYEVTFDVEGVKTTETYYYGQIPEYNQTPAKESTDNNYYEFSGWDKTFEPVTEDVTYTAVFTEFEYKYYDVNFFDFDGELLFTQNLKEGSIPTYTGDVPVIKDGNNNEYTFSGWLNRDTKIGYQNDLPKLTTNINYYAYSEDYYLTNTDYSVI